MQGKSAIRQWTWTRVKRPLPLKFLRDIPPLDFDPGLVDEYLDCFQADAAKAFVRDQLEHLYQELDDKRDRLKLMDVIGAPGVYFDEPEDDGLSE